MTENKTKPFFPTLLTSTQCYTNEAKARFGNALVAFVLSAFNRTKFTKMVYQHLSNCFGHIAEYDIHGFYSVWFSTATKQREWVGKVLDHTVYGDPQYTFSDVERQFKAWLRLHLLEVDELIDINALEEQDAFKREQQRLEKLAGATTQQFKVIAMSENVGSFGHHQFIMLARDGTCYTVQHIQSNGPWSVGMVFAVPLKQGVPTWAGMAVECPQRREDAPRNVINNFWKEVA